MQAFLRKTVMFPLLFATLVGGAPHGVAAPSDPPTEIRLGKTAAPAPKADPAQVRAIQNFFTARQNASLDRTHLPTARRMIAGGAAMDATLLAGEPGQMLAAFDFTDGAIERLPSGRFRVSVYVLFSDRQGRVVQSRNEVLTFAPSAGYASCLSLKATNVMRWDNEAVVKTAARLHVSQALERADDFLREWATQQRDVAAYSIEDVYPTGVNRVMIPCLQFSAIPGKRGYDVVDAPLMMRKGPKGYQLEPQAN